MAIAIKFTITGGDVDFTSEEVREVTLGQTQQTAVINNQVGAPYIHTSGNLWHTLTIQIAETKKDTRTRINQIIDEEKEMTIYYNYAYSTTAHIDALLIPDNIRKIYYFGEPGYGIVHILTFMETVIP